MFFGISPRSLAVQYGARPCAPCGPAAQRVRRPQLRLNGRGHFRLPGWSLSAEASAKQPRCLTRPERTASASPPPDRKMIGYPADCFRQKTDPQLRTQLRTRGAPGRANALRLRSHPGPGVGTPPAAMVLGPLFARGRISLDQRVLIAPGAQARCAPRAQDRGARQRCPATRAVRSASGPVTEKHNACSLPGRRVRSAETCKLHSPGVRLATIRPLRGPCSDSLAHRDVVSKRQLHRSASAPWRHFYRFGCDVTETRAYLRGEQVRVKAGAATGVRPGGCVPWVILRCLALNFL